jgi:hypothetical protein
MKCLDKYSFIAIQEYEFIRHLLDQHYLMLVNPAQWEQLMRQS